MKKLKKLLHLSLSEVARLRAIRSQTSLLLQKRLTLLLILSLLIHYSLFIIPNSVFAATFTAGQAKRDAPGPFAAAPICPAPCERSALWCWDGAGEVGWERAK